MELKPTVFSWKGIIKTSSLLYHFIENDDDGNTRTYSVELAKQALEQGIEVQVFLKDKYQFTMTEKADLKRLEDL